MKTKVREKIRETETKLKFVPGAELEELLRLSKVYHNCRKDEWFAPFATTVRGENRNALRTFRCLDLACE